MSSPSSWAEIVNPAPAADAVWLPAITCATGYAICGISTRVDYAGANYTVRAANTSSNDDSGISGITLKCCPLPNPFNTAVMGFECVEARVFG